MYVTNNNRAEKPSIQALVYALTTTNATRAWAVTALLERLREH